MTRPVTIALIVAGVGVAGFIGWRLYKARSSAPPVRPYVRTPPTRRTAGA